MLAYASQYLLVMTLDLLLWRHSSSMIKIGLLCLYLSAILRLDRTRLMRYSASFLLHEYQLLSTMHNTSPAAHDTNAATRSRLAIETMVDMMVNILREFPVAHTPELSPPALFAPYQAAMLGLLLDRISGFQRPPTLAGSTFDLMIGGLKHFSTVWPCTGMLFFV